jgi:ceramide glucosyltransferase
VVLTVVLTTLTGVSLALTLWQWLVAWRFPLHQLAENKGFTPPVTLLKPLKGADVETARCLRSWFEQDYEGAVQILFGVASENDPVVEVVRQLIAEYPRQDAQLVFCSKRLGANAKVSTLVQLERLARHDTVIVSDADVLVSTGFLRQLVLPLGDSRVGLVHCFYRLVDASGLATRLEALAVNADFWSQVLQAQALKPVDFALGAVMATRRAQLARVGGFVALADYVADDYQLGHRIAQSGARIALCPVVVECWSPPTTANDVWSHQLRWARTIRACRPLPYFLSLLGNATLWPLLLVLFGDRSEISWPLLPDYLLPSSAPVIEFSVPWTLLAFGSCLLVRISTAFDCARKLTQQSHFDFLWMAPLKDLFQVPLWILAFLGNQVTWRGQRLRITRGGKIVDA